MAKDTIGLKDDASTLSWQGKGGAGFVADGSLDFGPIYSDGTYKYFGEAIPGTALTAAEWRVSRMTISTSRIEYLGTGKFEHVFTDVSTVAGLF